MIEDEGRRWSTYGKGTKELTSAYERFSHHRFGKML
jgi:hypothetical protein